MKEIIRNGEQIFICQECDMAYSDKSWAEKCESWCKKHRSCNINIISHSIK